MKWWKLLLLSIILPLCISAQGFMDYDSLSFQMENLGYISYRIPISSSYDEGIFDYTDTFYVWVDLDSVGIDSAIQEQFHYEQITSNIWVAHMFFYSIDRESIYSVSSYDTTTCSIVTVIDTVTVTHKQHAVLIHLVPEMSPNWIEDLFGES